MAVAAAWVPVCAEDLTWRQLLILFWTNIRISTAIAANINHLHRKYKRIWTIWVFIFTGKFSGDCRSKGWYSLFSWIHLQGVLENLLGNMKLQKSWISWLTIDGSGLLLFKNISDHFYFLVNQISRENALNVQKYFPFAIYDHEGATKCSIWDCSICQFMFKCFLETLAGSCRLSILKCISIFWTDARGARKDL